MRLHTKQFRELFEHCREENDLTNTGDESHRQAVILRCYRSSHASVRELQSKGVADAQALRLYGVYRLYYDGRRRRPLSHRWGRCPSSLLAVRDYRMVRRFRCISGLDILAG